MIQSNPIYLFNPIKAGFQFIIHRTKFVYLKKFKKKILTVVKNLINKFKKLKKM